MIPASTPDEALEIAYQMKGRDASVVVIPDGVSVLALKELPAKPEPIEKTQKESERNGNKAGAESQR